MEAQVETRIDPEAKPVLERSVRCTAWLKLRAHVPHALQNRKSLGSGSRLRRVRNDDSLGGLRKRDDSTLRTKTAAKPSSFRTPRSGDPEPSDFAFGRVGGRGSSHASPHTLCAGSNST